MLSGALLTASKTLAQHSIINLSVRKKENKRVLMRTSESKSLSLNLLIKVHMTRNFLLAYSKELSK